ncbi:arginine--tRNA ligase [Evansella cellulosilytica]|uniref:Arginine--tRNA ligase n=1 Tax=Evansella cellulosilytica (strain ATCC 21833 / DSM 2522 / FERM P-1141 / JCM 9156 / N-4) TaxID=649639 RepID=E6TV14_EVAC2|nr:arginine--tRNA ligase [Evansella cellulosilytica]ADU28597.1 arginyl-tRNA synthetase [Evansella cellulosilytica DSM 2522]
MNMKEMFADALMPHLKETPLTSEQVLQLIEKPKYENLGDLAFPCFQLSKLLRKSPAIIANEIAEKLQSSSISSVEVKGAYVNVFFDKVLVGKAIIDKVIARGTSYGSNDVNSRGKVVIDFSSPNIAKPFSMGHLRSTVIGNALAAIAEKNGYESVKINHLGDWGTQFGKLITAYKLWGNEEEVRENTIPTLLKLYVQFHEEAEKDPTLVEEGRRSFQKLENGDQEAVALWKWFRNESLKEFNKVYTLLGVTFDAVQGESYYNEHMEEVVKELEEKEILEESDGALVVTLNDDMPPCLIQKNDGTTLYATRDLAAAKFRKETYDFVKCLYIVGGEQQLHFQQLFQVLQIMDEEWAADMVHIPFGLILKDGKKMSTRKGKVVLLEEVLQEAINKTKQNIIDKNPLLDNIDDVAKQVGVGAVIFHDLKNERIGNVEFNLDQMLTFEGETGPYVQYTIARGNTLLAKAKTKQHSFKGLDGDLSWEVIKLLEQFPAVIERAFTAYEPSIVAKYVIKLAQAFNSFYGNVKILQEDKHQESRLALTQSVTIVLTEGLRLLGMQAPEKM